MPVHLFQAMPVLVLGVAGLTWICRRRLRLRYATGEPHADARRDFAVGLALGASWCAVWGLYATYTWTTQPGLTTLASARFYVPALAAMALLGAWLVVRLHAWLVVRLPRRVPFATVAACVLVAAFGLGVWSFHAMLGGPVPASPGRPHSVIGS